MKYALSTGIVTLVIMAVAPAAFATPNADALQGELQIETSVPAALAAMTPDASQLDATHLATLERVEAQLNQTASEAADQDGVLELVVLDL